MRTYGRQGGGVNGIGGTWVEVSTDANGWNDELYLTSLCQGLLLALGESPFYSNYGTPATQSVISQVFPDFYAAQMQSFYAPFFASLTITRTTKTGNPAYAVSAVCHTGAILSATVAI